MSITLSKTHRYRRELRICLSVVFRIPGDAKGSWSKIRSGSLAEWGRPHAQDPWGSDPVPAYSDVVRQVHYLVLAQHH